MNKPVPPPDLDSDIIDTQNRTIRVLLANYDALLRKYENEHPKGDPPFALEWSVGDSKQFTMNQVIGAGWWIPLTTGTVHLNDHQSGVHVHVLVQYSPFYSEGTATAQGTLTLVPIETKIVRKPDGPPPAP